jgi:hypothetical protein
MNEARAGAVPPKYTRDYGNIYCDGTLVATVYSPSLAEYIRKLLQKASDMGKVPSQDEAPGP